MQPTNQHNTHARKGRLRALLLGLLLALLAAELVLQGVAYAVHLANRPAATDRPGSADVLCVGDSFTFGLGAAQGSDYPQQLARLLQQRLARECVVANAGWPGQTSREVLLRLPAQLQQLQPRVVCVLVGINDLGTPPARVGEPDLAATDPTGAPDDRSFALRCRLVLFARQIALALRGGPEYSKHRPDQQADPTPFVGLWHMGAYELTFQADGGIRLQDSPYGSWALRDERLLLDNVPGFGNSWDTRWQIAHDRLRLHLPDLGAMEFAPGASPLHVQLRKARAALRQDDPGRALAFFAEAFDDPEDSLAARAGAIESLAALARHGDAEAHLAWLQARYDSEPARTGVFLLRALVSLGRDEQALALTQALLAEPGMDQDLWARLAELSRMPAQHGLVQQIFARVLDSGRLEAGVQRELLAHHFRPAFASEPDRALSRLLRVAETADDGYLTGLLRGVGVDAARLQARCLELGADPRLSQRLGALAAGQGGRDRAIDTLRHHLRRVIELCHEAGAVPVLLEYPFRQPEIQALVRALAAEDRVPFAPVQARFAQALERKSWESLFVSDGHCNGDGYAIVARQVAEIVGPLLESRPK